MKKKMLIAAAVTLTACIVALAQSEVLSQNAVGYVKKTVPENAGLAVVVHSLESMDSVNLIFTNTSIASELPRGSKAYFWETNKWGPSTKNTKNGLWDGSGVGKVLQPGEAFFIQTPSGSNAVQVTIAGEVPDLSTMDVPIAASNNLTAAGNPYPVSVIFTNTAIASNLPRTSKVYFWETNQWSPSTKGSKNGLWDGSGVGKILEPGEGFFVQNASNTLTWTVEKAYTWP